MSLGEVGSTKTGTTRTVVLMEPLAKDLTEWRLASGRPAGDVLVFPAASGGPWSSEDWRNWRRRRYVVAAEAAGVASTRPYDLRHSFVSLLIHEGRSVVEVARQAGHSPTMALSTYAHVFDEQADGERMSAVEQIRRARSAADVSVLCTVAEPGDTPTSPGTRKVPMQWGLPQEPPSGFEPLTPSLRVKCSTS